VNSVTTTQLKAVSDVAVPLHDRSVQPVTLERVGKKFLMYSKKHTSRQVSRNLIWTRQIPNPFLVPSSNLLVTSKILERIVAKQLLGHLDMSQLLPWLQSDYRSKHPTETALVKVLSDILLAIDFGDLAALVLDLSAASTPLTTQFCSDDLKHLGFFSEDLLGRQQHVLLHIRLSSSEVYHRCTAGVPQGSVILGPILFFAIRRRPS